MHLTESSPLLSAPVLPLSWVPSFQFLDKSFKWLISFVLTTASLKEGWLPGASRDAHFWQPVPGLNNALMGGTMAQPSHEPPHKKETKTGPHHTEKYQRRKSYRERGEGGGGRGEEDGLKTSGSMDNAAQRKISTPLNHIKVVQE